MTHHDLTGTSPAAPGPNGDTRYGMGGSNKFAKNKLRPGSHPHQNDSSSQATRQLEELNIDDVHTLLEGLNMGSYADSFRAQEIDGATLAHCEDVDLEMLGMAFRPKRQRLLMAIDDLMEKGVKPALLRRGSSSSGGGTGGGERGMGMGTGLGMARPVGGGMGRRGGGRENYDMGNGNGSGGWTTRGGSSSHKEEMTDAQEDELRHWYGRRAGQSTKGISKPHLYY
jgi:hypothetical protein